MQLLFTNWLKTPLQLSVLSKHPQQFITIKTSATFQHFKISPAEIVALKVFVDVFDLEVK